MQRRMLLVATAVGAFVLLVAGGALAGAASTTGVSHDFTEARTSATQSDYYMVVFNDPPAASYNGGAGDLKRTKPERGQKLNAQSDEVRAYQSYLKGVHDDYRGWLASKAKKAEVVAEYSLVANALAIQLNGTRPDTLAQGPGVKKVVESWLYKPAMNVSNGLIDADALWPKAGGQANAGAGIKVGIIDTGIDTTHEFFACKGEIPAKVYHSGVAIPGGDDIVFDHGTHVAGTVAGCVTSPSKGVITETLSGVAPAAELYDYNVFPGYGGGFVAFGGSAFSHDICAAIEDSLADGMDVINMSIGGGVQGPHDSLAECTDAAVDGGLVAAVAAGNSGPGDSTVESPGSAAGALTAGASTNPHFIGVPFTAGSVSGGAAYGDFTQYPDSFTADYAKASPAEGCTTISGVAGKIALIDRGTCTFGTKVRNAEAAGAIGVLVANNVAGDPVAMGSDGRGDGTIPAAMVSKNDGAALGASGTITIDGDNPTEIKTTNADIIAGFSSRGPTPFTYLIKPDLTAPGVNVYSSVFNGEYAMFQGTSMATPHLAGSAAVLLQLHGDWSPADVKSALVTTAKRPVTDHVNGTAAVGVLARGGGRADLDAADAAPALISPASASFGYFDGNAQANGSVTLSVIRAGAADALCSVAVTNSDGRVAASPTAFTATSTSTAVTVTFSGGRAADTPTGDYSGDVVLTCNGTELKVPWWTRVNREGKP